MNFHVKYLRMVELYESGTDLLSLWTFDVDQYPSFEGQIYTIYPDSPSMNNASPVKCIISNGNPTTPLPIVTFNKTNSYYGLLYSDGSWLKNGAWYTKGYMTDGFDPRVFAEEIANNYSLSIQNNSTWGDSDYLSDFAGYITDLNLIIISGTLFGVVGPSGAYYIASFVYPGSDPNADEIIVI